MKRGRKPKHETMGDLDINLIREFARRPGLYDRNSAYYKDRTYIVQAWNEISQKLGFEIRLLKERMLQLRNRFNLEKRRIDTVRAKFPKRVVRSKWPLFVHMDFMSSHIKHRRSFSKMTTRQFHRPLSMDGGDTLSHSPPMTRIYDTNVKKNMSNGEIEVKNENILDIDEDPPSVNNMDHYIDEDTEEIKDEFLLRPEITINQPDLDGVRARNNVDTYKSSGGGDRSTAYVSQIYDVKEKKRIIRLQKYETFGKFLAMSLCDMPEVKAMKLIEKFTSDLVKSVLSTTTDQNNGMVVRQNQSHHHDQNNHSHHHNPVIQNVESFISKEEQPEQQQSLSEEKKNESLSSLHHDENTIAAAIPNSNSNSNSNQYGDECEDEEADHLIYDLTEDEPLSI